METRLFTGEFLTHSAEEWRRFVIRCDELDTGAQLCFLAHLIGAPDSMSPYSEAKEIAALIEAKMENDLIGVAVVAKTDPSNGFARILEMLLPEDSPYFVTDNIEEARKWLSKFSCVDEKRILLAA